MSDFKKVVAKKLNDDFLFVDDKEESPTAVISTGSLSMDISTGIKGIPKGRVTTIYGGFSSGKTTLCLEITRNALTAGDRVLYIDAEQGLDYNYINAIMGKMDTTKLIIAQPETAEEALTTAELGINGDEKLGLTPGQFDVIIVDSVAALAPEKEKEKDLTDSNIALLSRILGAFFRRNMYAIRKHNIAFIFVNQVRDLIGSYVGGYTFPGGHALKHYSSMIIFLSKGQEIKKGDTTIGTTSKYVFKKNKLAPPFRSFTLPIVFGTGIDKMTDAIDFSEMLGVVKKRGSYYYLVDEQLGQGITKVGKYLEEHADTLDRIRTLCYNVCNKIPEPEIDEKETDE